MTVHGDSGDHDDGDMVMVTIVNMVMIMVVMVGCDLVGDGLSGGCLGFVMKLGLKNSSCSYPILGENIIHSLFPSFICFRFLVGT